MEYNYENVSCNCFKEAAVADRVVEFKLPLADGASVAKVLSVVADGRAVKVDAADKSVSFSGRVNFRLVYLSNENVLQSLDYFADFDENISAEVSSGDVVYGEAKVLETDLSGDEELKLCSVVRLTVYVAQNRECKCLTSVPSDCYVECEEIRLNSLIGSVVKDFSVTDEAFIGGDIEKILTTDSDVAIYQLKPTEGGVFVSGEMCAAVTYLIDDTIKCARFNVPFSEEVPFKGLNPDDGVTAKAEVKNVRIIIGGTEGDNNIEIEALIGVRINGYKNCELSVAVDVFMPNRELIAEKGSIEMTAFDKALFFDDKFTDSARISETRPAVREILAVTTASNTVAKVWSENSTVCVEGIVGATIIYKDENGFNSVKAELPYSVGFSSDMGSDAVLKAEGSVGDVSAKIKRDREIELSVKLCFAVEAYTEKTMTYIDSVAEGEEKPLNDSAISVYIASEGDTIWDVAKAFSASPDKILEQNEIDKKLVDGQKIVYFRSLV